MAGLQEHAARLGGPDSLRRPLLHPSVESVSLYRQALTKVASLAVSQAEKQSVSQSRWQKSGRRGSQAVR